MHNYQRTTLWSKWRKNERLKAQKDVGNKVPIYKLKETKEVMDFYDEWGQDNKYDQDMVDWNYTGPK